MLEHLPQNLQRKLAGAPHDSPLECQEPRQSQALPLPGCLVGLLKRTRQPEVKGRLMDVVCAYFDLSHHA